MSECSSFANARYGSTTVPEKMIGCWERLYIRFRDGSEDRSTRVFWLQTLFYILAILGALRPSTRRFKPVAIANTFVMLNAAAALAFYNFVAGRNRVWV